jgi:hypothetical protein
MRKRTDPGKRDINRDWMVNGFIIVIVRVMLDFDHEEGDAVRRGQSFPLA